jgi:hypothetical protein
LIISQYFK